MKFGHDEPIWSRFPQLGAYVLYVRDVSRTGDTSKQQEQLLHRALTNLGDGTESDLAPIQAWRKTYAAMGYKPTQYRCASESLLRRLRKSGDLPQIHPFVDLCNSASAAFALPVAAFDLQQVSGSLTVTHADGTEAYQAFNGALEVPDQGEVIFRDDDARAHARRWVHRQSALSAITPESDDVLVVIEGFHQGVETDLEEIAGQIESALGASGHAHVAAAAALNSASREIRLGQ